MAKNCGQPEDYFLNIVHEKSHADWYLDAEEWRKHNMASHLHMTELKIKASVTFDFG